MNKFKIKNADIAQLLNVSATKYPKDLSSLFNFENQFAQATRPKNIGQMSELIIEYRDLCKMSNTVISVDGWEVFYNKKQPGSIKKATEALYNRVVNVLLKDSLGGLMGVKVEIAEDNQIKTYCGIWIKELIIDKTYAGMFLQDAILKDISEKFKLSYRASRPEEESKGIDGVFSNNVIVSIKSSSYEEAVSRSEIIEAPLIKYEKKKDGVTYVLPKLLIQSLTA